MTTAIEEVPAGTMIAGRFRVEALLGSGGMADVYRAIDAATGEPLALKLIRPVSGSRGAEVEDRVRREGEILRVLAHPAIVRIETFGRTEDGLFFIAMELLEGETLGEVMRRGRLSPQELVPIVAGTCAGLAAAHDKGIVHRDLKPDNIFLTQDGGALQVKLLDFGIARLDDAAKKITKTGEILGTPRYMAPELLSAERNIDGRTDTYALGVILFEALAGEPPYLAANPTDLIVAILHAKHSPLGSICRGLLPAVEAVVARAMARAREARYATAPDLAEAYLSAAAAGAPGVTAPRVGMGTAVLGSMGAAGAASGTGSGDLELGTFSQLPQVTPGEAEAGKTRGASGAGRGGKGDASSRAFAKTALARVSQRSESPSPDVDGAMATRKKGSARRSGGHRGRSSDGASGPGSTVALADGPISQESGQRSRSDADSFDDTTYRLPTTGGRMKLIIMGLLAGALSAGLAIAALSLFGKGDVPSSEERHGADAGARGGDDQDDEDDEGRADGARPAIEGAPGAPPTGVDVPDESEFPQEHDEEHPSEAGGASAGPRRRSSMRGSGMARRAEVIAPPRVGDGIETRAPARDRPPTPGTPPVFAPTPASPPVFVAPPTPAPGPSAAELVRDARGALRDGNPSRCADLARRAVRAGGGHAAVRLHGDCLLGSGDRAGALAAYERFCRGAPDHPSASQVRSIVESMGGHCD